MMANYIHQFNVTPDLTVSLANFVKLALLFVHRNVISGSHYKTTYSVRGRVAMWADTVLTLSTVAS